MTLEFAASDAPDSAQQPALGAPSTDPAAQSIRRQQAIVAIGRRVVALPDLSLLLHDAAQLLADMLELEHTAVAEIQEATQAVSMRLLLQARNAAARSLTQQFPWPGNEALVGYAIQSARPVAVCDLSQERQTPAPWLRKFGVASGIAVPLQVHEQSFGALLAAGQQPRQFSDEDLLAAESIAHLISATIARHRAEVALDDQQRVSQQVFETVEALVLLLDPQGRIVQINQAGQRLTGFGKSEITGRTVASVFPIQHESEVFQQIFEKLNRGATSLQYESYLLTKSAQRRRIAWSYSAVRRGDGVLDRIVATGVDVTARREAEEKAQKAEQSAQDARVLLQKFMPSFADGKSDKSAAAGDPAARNFSPVVAAFGDRRGRDRQPFPYQQLVGPIVDGKMPDRDKLVPVLCRDISPGGLSFLMSTPPISDSFVVALGQGGKLTYVVAQVAHVTRVEQDGAKMYLIGCNYTGRAPM